jgi:hypothetical protein
MVQIWTFSAYKIEKALSKSEFSSYSNESSSIVSPFFNIRLLQSKKGPNKIKLEIF